MKQICQQHLYNTILKINYQNNFTDCIIYKVILGT